MDQSSGNLTADRRYTFAQDLARRGDLAAAVDLFAQALELAPDFVPAWFGLGEVRAQLGQTAEAIAAFRKVQSLDPHDRHGAGLHLIRLGADAPTDMPEDYVRTLFDQYAARFDDALTHGLSYRAPDLLLSAVTSACRGMGRPLQFRSAVDLGCGTGLGGTAFRASVDQLTGIDLSPNMIEQARSKGIYDRLIEGDILPFLAGEAAAQFNLVLAADVFAYFADLGALMAACARVLAPRGLLAFTVETHAGDDILLGEKLRYAHGAAHIRTALANAKLALRSLDNGSSRLEAGNPVPGLVVVAQRL